MYASKEMEEVYKKVLTDPSVRNTMIIEILNRFGESKRTFKLAEAWVSKWEGSDLDAGSDDVAIEKITVQFEYFLD
jgi:phage tail-like protein